MKANRIATGISASMILALVLSGCGSQSSSNSEKIEALEQRVLRLESRLDDSITMANSRLNATNRDLRQLRECRYSFDVFAGQTRIDLSRCR